MANASVDGNPVWYPLSAHDDNSSPLGPPTPVQSPSGVASRTDANESGKPIIPHQLLYNSRFRFIRT